MWYACGHGAPFTMPSHSSILRSSAPLPQCVQMISSLSLSSAAAGAAAGAPVAPSAVESSAAVAPSATGAPRTAQPLRVVLGRAPADAGLLKDGLETVVFSKDDGLDGAGAAALPGVLRALHRRGVNHLMVEGGPQTARYFLEAELVDRAIVVRAPVAFADKPVPSGITAATLRSAGLSFHSRRDVGGDDTHVWTRGAHAPLWGMLLDEPP